MNAIEHIPAPKTEEKQAKYFHFSQNNSGGSFHINNNVAHHVIVQAHTADEANRLAEDIGIYFDGCNSARDCSCCGDRWSRQWSGDKGDDTPMIYSKSPEGYHDSFTRPGQPVCHVYHLDGSKTTYRKQEKAQQETVPEQDYWEDVQMMMDRDMGDSFAAKAMQGLMDAAMPMPEIAEAAYDMADAMLKAREQ